MDNSSILNDLLASIAASGALDQQSVGIIRHQETPTPQNPLAHHSQDYSPQFGMPQHIHNQPSPSTVTNLLHHYTPTFSPMPPPPQNDFNMNGAPSASPPPHYLPNSLSAPNHLQELSQQLIKLIASASQPPVPPISAHQAFDVANLTQHPSGIQDFSPPINSSSPNEIDLAIKNERVVVVRGESSSAKHVKSRKVTAQALIGIGEIFRSDPSWVMRLRAMVDEQVSEY